MADAGDNRFCCIARVSVLGMAKPCRMLVHNNSNILQVFEAVAEMFQVQGSNRCGVYVRTPLHSSVEMRILAFAAKKYFLVLVGFNTCIFEILFKIRCIELEL